MIEFSKFFSLQNEMALTNMQKIGKWDDKKNRHGYDKQSVGILSSPAGLKKIEDKFNRIGDYDFNLYFVKLPNAWKQVELGEVRPEELKKLIGVEPGVDFPSPGQDEITVIFTNNSAAERTPLTAWTIAHRIGHAFSATFRRGRDSSIDYYLNDINQILKSLFSDCYGKEFQNRGYGGILASNEPIVRNLFESIGKMRSARMKKLPRTSEFIYECFAQYLLSGKLSFNPLPDTLTDSNRKAWGNATGRTYRMRDRPYADEYVERLRQAFEELFDYYLGRHIGTMSIM